jgi:hypothetical protein
VSESIFTSAFLVRFVRIEGAEVAGAERVRQQ